MPKRKKQKTTHHSHLSSTTNTTSAGLLSHEEIWDDSALLNSWNNALAEYDFYHSIHARGEDVDEVLRRVDEEERAEAERMRKQGSRIGDEIRREEGSADEGEISDAHGDDVMDGGQTQVASSTLLNQSSKVIGLDRPPVSNGSVPVLSEGTSQPVPQAPTGSMVSLDQTLENIKMAYYWAGYYSGLYDGQRQAGGD